MVVCQVHSGVCRARDSSGEETVLSSLCSPVRLQGAGQQAQGSLVCGEVEVKIFHFYLCVSVP